MFTTGFFNIDKLMENSVASSAAKDWAEKMWVGNSSVQGMYNHHKGMSSFPTNKTVRYFAAFENERIEKRVKPMLSCWLTPFPENSFPTQFELVFHIPNNKNIKSVLFFHETNDLLWIQRVIEKHPLLLKNGTQFFCFTDSLDGIIDYFWEFPFINLTSPVLKELNL